MSENGNINWERLARMNTHQLQIMILEELNRGGEPMSAKLLAETFMERENLPYKVMLGQLSYHVRCLHKAGLIEMTHQIPRRGSRESFYVVA